MATATATDEKVRVLFVCLGNICRSPLAEGVFRRVVEEHGLADLFEIESAGTGHWHIGEPPDERMRQTARSKGLSIDEQRARQFAEEDLAHFDHIFVMDKENLNDVLYFDQDERYGGKVRLFREFDPEPGDYQVPDPYFGGARGFDNVYDIVDRTSRMLLHRLIEEHGLAERVDQQVD